MRSSGVWQPAGGSNAAGQSTVVPSESLPPEILVVADDSGILPAIGAMLQCRGFQVILAPDSQTALQEMGHYDVAAVIAGASPEQENGLDFLGVVKEQHADVKTLVVTQLLNPALPARAYEMDIDDYLHWPLTGAELSNRLRDLLGTAEKPPADKVVSPDTRQDCPGAQAALDVLMDGCTQALSKISQTVKVLRRQYIQEMSPAMAQELQALAGSVQSLSQRLCQVWSRSQALPTACRQRSRRLH